MKTLFSVILISTFCIGFQASAQNTKTDKTEEFDVNGLQVILKQTPKEVISARLFIRGGTANYSVAKEGIENVTLQLMIEGGTKSLSKAAYKTAAEKLGTQLDAKTQLDFGTISMTCVKSYWNESWTLFSEAIIHPALGETEFNLLKEQLISDAKQMEGDPDEYLVNLSKKVAFPGQDYIKVTTGTEKSLTALTLLDAQNYYAKTIGKKRCFLVVVGNISKEELTQKIKESLDKMPIGTAPTIQKIVKTAPKQTAFMEDRDIATNYIRGIISAPKANSKEGVATKIAMSILYDRFFTELRTKRSLSYAPAAFYVESAVTSPYSVLYITTTKPKESIQVMVDEINAVKKYGFKNEELINKRQDFLTNYYLTLETTGSQADALGLAQIQGNWRQVDALNKAVTETTLKELNTTFDTYSNRIIWTYLGKKEAVKDTDFKQPNKK
ncbi:M16 family metallopeptidase [Flavobacterium restrictum]|uniref:Insulinase family protein n=1 Tax=Flavobacterium restrictum TaxID=2594428 RepID=A0A553EBI2_9FLAO|nr:pitrilysin family protein [Flavobacterium restrictum]TRX42143.1 insulinase family protein [Flavobacterium restrictum]